MCVHVREWDSMCVRPCIIRIPRQTLMQRSRALEKLRPQPVEQGWTGRAPLQGPQRRALRLGSWRRGQHGQEAQSTQATPKSEAGQEGRLPGAREACSRQVTQPTSSPEKCVSETCPVQ